MGFLQAPVAPLPGQEPGDVRGLAGQRADHRPVRPGAWSDRARPRPASSSPSPSGCGSPCCSPTSPRPMAEGRGKAQADGACAGCARRCGRRSCNEPHLRFAVVHRAFRRLAAGDVVLVQAGDVIPADGEVIEGVASVDESAITGESAPVIRESGGDFCAVTGGTRVLSDWLVMRVDGQSGRDLPRPHDRHGGSGQAPEDPQRDCADHPAGGADTCIPYGHRDPSSVLALQRGRSSCGYADRGYCADRAAGLPDPHHHRRAALGHRNSRHGPHDGKKCHCHIGAGGGSGRRRGRAAAGQDRHHHPGQPPGGRFRSGAGCAPGRAHRGRDACLAGR